MKISTTFLIWLLTICSVIAQEDEGPDPLLGLHFNYGFQIPGGDLADDFGWANSTGLGFEYQTSKDYIFGLEGGVFFSNRVKNDVIASLRGPDSLVIGSNGDLADINLKERGIDIKAQIGKVFNINKQKNRSGIRTTLGLGILQHKVRIQEDFNTPTPQLSEEYTKGYDQLTNGLLISEYVGYQLLSKNGLVNFRIGVEFGQAFTQNRRSWDFEANLKKDEKRLELTQTLKLSWILPFYLIQRPDEIFY